MYIQNVLNLESELLTLYKCHLRCQLCIGIVFNEDQFTLLSSQYISTQCWKEFALCLIMDYACISCYTITGILSNKMSYPGRGFHSMFSKLIYFTAINNSALIFLQHKIYMSKFLILNFQRNLRQIIFYTFWD